MDKNKCPKLKTQKTFWKKIDEQYNILKLLKENKWGYLNH
jgi:hypothetical protein